MNGFAIYYAILIITDILAFTLCLLLLVFLSLHLVRNDGRVAKEFYLIFVINGFSNLFFIVEEYFSFRLPTMSLFPSFYMNVMTSSPFTKICLSYAMAQLMINALFVVLVSLNRFISLYYPLKYQYIFSGNRLVAIIIVPILFGIVYFVSFVSYEATYYLNEDDGRMAMSYSQTSINFYSWLVLLIVHFVCLIGDGILNLLIIRKIRMISKKMVVQKQIIKSEYSLIRFSQINFLCSLLILMLDILLVVSSENGSGDLYANCLTLYLAAETVTAFFSPFALLCVSNEIRKIFFIFIGVKRFGTLNKNTTQMNTINPQLNHKFSQRNDAKTSQINTVTVQSAKATPRSKVPIVI